MTKSEVLEAMSERLKRQFPESDFILLEYPSNGRKGRGELVASPQSARRLLISLREFYGIVRAEVGKSSPDGITTESTESGKEHTVYD